MDFFGNDKRKNRCEHLIASMEASLLAMNNAQNAMEAKTDFFKEIILKAALARGYPTIEALEADMTALMDEADKSDVAQFKASQDGLTKMHTVVGSFAFLSMTVGAYGTIRMKRQFGRNILPWNRFNNSNQAKLLKNALSYRLTVVGPRELKCKLATGKISQSVFNKKMADFSLAASMIKMRDASEFAKGGKFADAPIVLESARMLKRMARITTFFEIAGWVAEIAAIVTDVIVGAVMRDKLRGAINELAAQRFMMKKLQLMGDVYDKFTNRVSIAVGVWVSNQAAALRNETCYVAADDALEEELAAASVFMEENMAKVCDCAVLAACAEDDKLQNSWTNEDPSYRQILEYLGEPNPTDHPECEVHFPTGNPAPSLPPAAIYPTVLKAEAITAANCRYVELLNGQGCFWRIRGGFWTLQQPLSTTATTPSEPLGLQGTRIQLQEKRRTADRIYLQNISNWTWDPTVSNWLPPSSSQLFPFVVLNFASGKVETLPGTTNLNSAPGTATVQWGSRALDPASYSNLTKINGWTLYYVPTLPPAAGTSALAALGNAHECNPVKGWEYNWPGPGEGAGVESNLIEVIRGRDIIQVAKKGRTGVPKWPKGWVDVVEKTLAFEEEEGSKREVYAIDVDIGVMWKARMNYS